MPVRKYKYYYSYKGELYGVIEETEDQLDVLLIRTQEKETVTKDWLQRQVEHSNAELSKDYMQLGHVIQKKLEEYLSGHEAFNG